MTIYQRKDKRGKPTGLWVVEVTVHGQKRRETTRDFARTSGIEHHLKNEIIHKGVLPPYPSRPASLPPDYTVGRLSRDALVVWKGTKDEMQSTTRFLVVCDILGHATPLASVRTVKLDAVVDTLRSRSLGNKTIHRYLSALSAAMRWATSRDHIAGRSPPATASPPPRERTPRLRGARPARRRPRPSPRPRPREYARSRRRRSASRTGPPCNPRSA